MAKADHRLYEALGRATQTLDCPGTIMVRAKLAATKAVKRELQAQGVKLAYIKRATIDVAAKTYLREHPELIEEAAQSIRSYPPLLKLAEREHRDRARCSNISSAAQRLRA